MCHVCGFICYLCVELKSMINTRSLSNQALKSAHRSLLSSRCWPWVVFIGAGQPLQHGEVRDTNLAWVRLVVFLISDDHTTIWWIPWVAMVAAWSPTCVTGALQGVIISTSDLSLLLYDTQTQTQTQTQTSLFNRKRYRYNIRFT